MFIREIEPIGSLGQSVVNKENSDELIDKMLELPVRQACRVWKEKGIETVMSSANKNNVLREGKKRLEKEDVRDKEFYLDSPTFKDAGRGYAWIMLNFDSLSCQNKTLLFHLEQKKDEEGNAIGEKAIWFMRGSPTYLSDLFASQSKFQKQKSTENKEEKALSDEFEKRHFVLSYANDYYPKRVVVIRMPINEETTVEEVNDFFTNFARSFYTQEKEIEEERVFETSEK